MEDATAEELAGIYTEVAEKIGMDNAYILFQHFRGQQLTFPLKFYSSDCLARRICMEEKQGCNTREMARKYGYSESRIRQILSQEKNQITNKQKEKG